MLAFKETQVPLDIFFTFPVLDTDDQRRVLVRWCANAKLQRHIEALAQQNPQFNEATLAKTFMDAIQQSPPVDMAKNHLVAFLASFSYRCAARIQFELEQLNHVPSDAYGFLQDLFQSAFEIALFPIAFFQNFESEKTQEVFWYFSLKGYTRRKMEGLLRDKVRSIEGLQTYGRTDLGLAARSSEKRVTSALRALGEPESKIVQLVLAWKCFQEARTAKVLQIDSPQPQQFEAIAIRYNGLKAQSSFSTMPDLAGITAEKWLKTIGAAIRRYCDRSVESLDIQVYQGGMTWGELMVDESSNSDTSTLSKVEIQPDLRNLKQLLTDTLQFLGLDLKRIFLLKYGLNLTQTQIGAALKKHQSSISRTQRNFEESLLQQFTERFDAKALNVPSGLGIDPDIFLALRDYLNQYWEDYYAEMMHQFFRESTHALEPQLQDGLRLAYRDLSNSNTVQPHDLETRSVLQAQRVLLESISLRIQDYGQLAPEAQSAIQKRLNEMITQWLLTSA
jgi:hypothetical protein